MQVTAHGNLSQQLEQQQGTQSHPQDSDEAEAFLQPTFINILDDLTAVTEKMLLPESAQIEADTKVLIILYTSVYVL